MTLTQLAPPYPIFTDKSGDPLDNGYLYFGVVDKNPETDSIQIYYDANLTQPVAQPVRTSNGYVMRNGTPAIIFADSQFSVTVRDKNRDLVIYSPVGYGIDPGAISGVVVVQDHVGDGVTTIFGIGASPSSENATNVYIDGVYQNKSTYSTSGTTLTFSQAPPLYSAIEIVSNQTGILAGPASTTAQQVIYNEASPGAVNRTVQNRLQERVSVKDFGAVGDGVTDDTSAIQTAFNSGAKSIYFPEGTYIASSLTMPNTVKELYGLGSNRSGASKIKFDTSTTATTAFAIASTSSGLFMSNLHFEFRTGSYTNGILIGDNTHFCTFDNVTTDDSAAPGSYRVSNHWVLGANCWSNVFRHCGAWGPDHVSTIGITLGFASNDMDFYSCRWIHCGVGAVISGGSTEVVNFYGGEIASNQSYGVLIGNTSGTTNGSQDVSFNGVYFEDQPINIYQNESNFKGLHCYNCHNSATTLQAHIFLNQITYSVHIVGGAYLANAIGTSYLLDVNSKVVVDAFIVGPYLSNINYYGNNGAQQVWLTHNRIGGSPGQISFETKGIQATEDYNTTYSFAGRRLKAYAGNGVNETYHDKNTSQVTDNLPPDNGSSIWNGFTFTQGSICWNNGVSAGGSPGWACVTAGTPGTWKALANVAV
tara:strand:- start:3490 stop:5430 length:1941 start_codon:yes stop_codon:yes gene_type:complete